MPRIKKIIAVENTEINNKITGTDSEIVMGVNKIIIVYIIKDKTNVNIINLVSIMHLLKLHICISVNCSIIYLSDLFKMISLSPENDEKFSSDVGEIALSLKYGNIQGFKDELKALIEDIKDKNVSFQLLYRKGISLYKMNDLTYQHVLKTAFYLISNETYRDLHDLYKTHILKTYNIILEVENDK